MYVQRVGRVFGLSSKHTTKFLQRDTDQAGPVSDVRQPQVTSSAVSQLCIALRPYLPDLFSVALWPRQAPASTRPISIVRTFADEAGVRTTGGRIATFQNPGTIQIVLGEYLDVFSPLLQGRAIICSHALRQRSQIDGIRMTKHDACGLEISAESVSLQLFSVESCSLDHVLFRSLPFRPPSSNLARTHRYETDSADNFYRPYLVEG